MILSLGPDLVTCSGHINPAVACASQAINMCQESLKLGHGQKETVLAEVMPSQLTPRLANTTGQSAYAPWQLTEAALKCCCYSTTFEHVACCLNSFNRMFLMRYWGVSEVSHHSSSATSFGIGARAWTTPAPPLVGLPAPSMAPATLLSSSGMEITMWNRKGLEVRSVCDATPRAALLRSVAGGRSRDSAGDNASDNVVWCGGCGSSVKPGSHLYWSKGN